MAHMMHHDLLDVLARCAAECDHCVYNVCLGDPNMKTCGRMCLDCAQVCHSTSVYVSRMSRFMDESLRMCADIGAPILSEEHHAPLFSAFSTFAQVSRRVAVRLKTSFSGVESLSTQK